MSPQKNVIEEHHAPRIWIRPYYRSFNGLRGLAVFAVFLSHYAGRYNAWLYTDSWAWTGVDLFFVLSGFLITGILYDSIHDGHFFRNFYIRRALRIFPIFYGFFLLLFLLIPILKLKMWWSILEYTFYLGNLIAPFTDLDHHNLTIVQIWRNGRLIEFCNIGHLWSLCVEEQFYLLWPAVVWYVRDRKRLMQICLIASIFALLLRTYIRFHMARVHHFYPMLIHWSTYTRYDTLLIGSWLALWLRDRKLSLVDLRRISLRLMVLPAIVLFGVLEIMYLRNYRAFLYNNIFLCSVGYTLIGLICAGVVLRSLDESGTLSHVLQLWPLRTLGVISYGFYFFHMLPEAALNEYGASHPRFGPWVPLIAFVLTITVATLSFHFYETPFLKLKSRLAPGHRSVPSGNEV